LVIFDFQMSIFEYIITIDMFYIIYS